ncbi:MAG: DNA-processing protein DprA [Agitococcus sp.]|nr:DNA-processing protein DprA [Agitococcus sp.]
MMTEKLYLDWVFLWRLVGQSSSNMHKLLRFFGEPTLALGATVSDWQQAGIAGKGLAIYQDWQNGQDKDIQRDLAKALKSIEQQQQQVITLHDPRYPLLLKEIPDAPPLLFCRGEVSQLSWPQVAMVGSRRPSQNGLKLAEQFATELSQRGIAITSGLALGIDGAAHYATVKAKGITLAVLGTGLSEIYPKQHQTLAEQIVANDGVLISEFLPHTPPINYHFPRRNRIISGLSLGVLVVEAALPSGTLITAQLAADQNREVWAIPGSIFNPQVKGCHALIRQGAKLVEETAHILEDIAPRLGQAKSGHFGGVAPMSVNEHGEISQEAQQVLAVLGWQVQHFDALIEQGSWDAASLAGWLMELELAGRIATVSGGYEQLKSGS